MLKTELTADEIEKINELSKSLFTGATSAYSGLESIRLLLINLQISCSKIIHVDNPVIKSETAALTTAAEVIRQAVINIEEATKGGRDVSKAIANIINTEK